MRKLAAALAVPLAALLSAPAAAQDTDSPTREAGKHFQRAVALYAEADYRASLVEFKRAYALSPNAAVLYNVGEAEYQVQDYAAALTTFQRYLAESPPVDAHRAEVESDIEVLRTRVGHLTVTTIPAGADITIDDQSVGKTPLDAPLLVSIGHRKVAATIAGRPPSSRYVDVAAEDDVSVSLALPALADSLQTQTPRATISRDASPASSGGIGPVLRIAGWCATVAFVGGAATFGVLANKASIDLRKARNSYPTTAAALNSQASRVTTYSVLADSLAAAAIVIGDITLFSTLSSSSATSAKRAATGQTRVVLGPASARIDVTF